jgi:hypothetical protein
MLPVRQAGRSSTDHFSTQSEQSARQSEQDRYISHREVNGYFWMAAAYNLKTQEWEPLVAVGMAL